MDLISACQQLFSADLRPVNPYDRPDAKDIVRTVFAYARRIGCTFSNSQAAVSWALGIPEGRGTPAAVKAGKEWARRLYARQTNRPTPEAA